MTSVVPYRGGATDAGVVRATRDWIELLGPAAELARTVTGTEFVPAALRRNPAAITAAILYGDEIGLGPMQSLSKVHIIDGRPTIAAETMRALILAAGHDIWIEEKSNTTATVAGKRIGSDHIDRTTWTIDDARKAELLGKTNWKRYPRAMLIARATAELARDRFGDVIGGLAATEEESEDFASVAEPEVTEPPPARTSTRRRADKAPQPPVVAVEAPVAPAPVPDTTEHPSGQSGPTAPPLSAVPDTARPPLPGEEQQLITDAQMRLQHRLFNERGIRDRDERLAYVRELIGRPELQSSKELTVDEAARLIDQLQAGDPPPPNDQDEPI